VCPLASPLDLLDAGLAQDPQVMRNGGLLDRYRGLQIANAHLAPAPAKDPQQRQPDGMGEQLQACRGSLHFFGRERAVRRGRAAPGAEGTRLGGRLVH
jgi:hypothetical protein